MSIRIWSWTLLLAAGVLLASGWSRSARAEEPDQVASPGQAEGAVPVPVADPRAGDSGAPARGFTSSRNIEDKVREQRQARKAIFDFGLRDALLRLDDEIYKRTHLRLAAAYTVLYQHAYGGSGPRDAVGGDFDITASWDAVRSRGKTTGALEGALEGRNAFGDTITPSQLSTTIDSLWTTTSGFNEQKFSLVQLYWRQDLLGDRLHLRFGKVSGYSTFFGNRINSSSLYFVNFAFSDNPAVFFPGNGLGLHATWDFSPRWSVSAGIQNANGVKTEIDPSTLEYGEFWYALQFQYHATIRGLGEGTYRLGGWYTMPRTIADTPEGGGTVLSIDQELGKHLIGILRYEYQGQDLLNPEVEFDALTGTESALRVGLGCSSLIAALPDDYMGIALAWGVPADTLARDSYVAEIFYRSQIETASQFTLSLQLIESSTIFEQVFVLSARYRLEF